MQLHLSPQRAPARAILGMVTASFISILTTACAADRSQEYRFEVVDQPVAVSAHSEFNVKLTKVSTGEPVENATITQSHLEMTMMHPPHKSAVPGSMSTEMGGEVKVLGTPAPGLYRLMGDVSMPGTWKLDVSAKVPGEPEAIDGTATFKAGR